MTERNYKTRVDGRTESYVYESQISVPRGFRLQKVLKGTGARVNKFSYSRDGRFLATPFKKGTIRLWDSEPERVVRRLVGHTRPVIAVSWSPDSRRLVSASIDRRH